MAGERGMAEQRPEPTSYPTVYVFVRGDCWYPLEGTIRDDEDARRNAEHNPGTIRVIRMLPDSEEVVWEIGDG